MHPDTVAAPPFSPYTLVTSYGIKVPSVSININYSLINFELILLVILFLIQEQ